ncbi:uncharacterized protein LOC111542351 isoform X1 [Piliocolobus tephrosceles]|uniref:uncharacterized protein LOC111542351 isoform X1 n=1 Tax=Piliocolobus tephrosceles TaxID=591936 RepID=UPI000C2B1E75|nr:uncharacterized protein LOC111542351 isoform X1 [Piliocolobus tephrosceles]
MGPAPWTPGPGRLLPHSRNSGRTDLAAPAALAGEYKSQQLPPGWGSGRCPRHAPQTGPSDGPDLPHGTLDLAELERMITRGLRSPSHQVCELICLENSHSTLRGPGPLHRLPTPGAPPGPDLQGPGPPGWGPADEHGTGPACPTTHIVEHCDSVFLPLQGGKALGWPPTAGGAGRPSRRQCWFPELHPWQPAPGSPLTPLQTGLCICAYPGPRTGMCAGRSLSSPPPRA